MVYPTEEQQAAVKKFLTGRPLKIAAFAGTGKTTTLKMLAEATGARGAYLAFNKLIANEAKEKFPRSVDCRTTHAIAFRAVMPQYRSSAKMTKALHAKQLATVLAYDDRIFPGTFRLNGVHQAHLVLGTLRRFCQSSDPVIGLNHVPKYGRLLGAREEVISDIRGWAVAEANILWRRMVDKADEIPLGHDGYLKLWALTQPTLNAEYIMLDEAQDTNAVVLGVLARQQAQVVYVGDRHQQIYEWRGAVNAMEKIAGCEEAALTESFRFGPEIAAAASRVLATLAEEKPLRGSPDIKSTITSSGRADAVLARTNATVILEVLEASRVGQKPCVCGGTQELKRLLSDVYELKAGKPGVCPEFFGFQKWAEVVEFAESEEGQSLRTFVQIVEQHGESKLWAAVSKAVAEEKGADVILSTAHKAKGREWDSVRLASDFMNSRLGRDPDAESEVRLFYVAMTRAKRLLIAEPELLRIFTTDAWKTKQTEPRPFSARGATADSGRQPQPAHRVDVRDMNLAAAGMQHPGAATTRRSTIVDPPLSAPASPRPRVQPRPRVDLITEITPEASVVRHPGAVTNGGVAGAQKQSPRGKFWSRLARLFGTS
jgi:AAA domain-containing protein/UvrD-like helicase family protein